MDHYFPSHGEGQIHYCRWCPDGEVKAIVQIVHGIAEHVERYDDFAVFLNGMGVLVAAEDHMGHGKSMDTGTQGYFAGGWFAAVEDTHELSKIIRAEYPRVPFVIMGHSMGSFMTRTYLTKYAGEEISAAILCGTGWMPEAVLKTGLAACRLVGKIAGERKPSALLEGMAFGGYNKRVEHPRTAYDWINRDDRLVDAYIADPKCGFTPTAGLLRELMAGMLYNQQAENLKKMDPDVPVLFIAGGDDPVGNYGAGVRRTAQAFRDAGVKSVTEKIYPLMRHEVLNELNHAQVYADVAGWLKETVSACQGDICGI